ncbi:MAG: ACP phosphodiesterase [Flavihumibacter sp.]|nr:ACP phosphodiesterase [Flavihumibacter sp.]
MNYLAHAYLSFNNPAILTGNLISDFVKGKKQFEFDSQIQKGIQLHRAIDAFTDEHAATKTAKEIFRPAYRLYSAAFVDVAYDHFLATDPNHFTDTSLAVFARHSYALLQPFSPVFPDKFKAMFPYMQSQNWLYNYRLAYGIERSFQGITRRAAYLSDFETAFSLFNQHYHQLKACYDDFFPQLYNFSQETYYKLVSRP